MKRKHKRHWHIRQEPSMTKEELRSHIDELVALEFIKVTYLPDEMMEITLLPKAIELGKIIYPDAFSRSEAAE